MIFGATISTRQVLIETLEPYEEIQAAALYGSVARGDSESHSDVDVLLICSGGCKREVYDSVYPVLSERFERLSLSIYSPREITFLAKARSLFLLHLQRESVLLFDRTDLLRSTLEHFEPKASYTEDFQRSLELFAPLNKIVSESPNSFHRLAYIYSLFRVYGVYLLAEHGICEFSKAKMADSLAAIRPDQYSNIALLSKLRVLNANFFSGGELNRDFLLGGGEEVPSLQACALALGELARSHFTLTFTSYRDAVQGFLDAAQCSSLRLGYRLRTWFLLLVYDGLNLYARENGVGELSSFDTKRLLEFTSTRFPQSVREAARESLEYLRNYPLKYFLLEESKIPVKRACTVLVELSETVQRDFAL